MGGTCIFRVLSRIFSLGEKIRLEIAGGWGGGGGGGCSHRLEFSRGVWGHVPPEKFCHFEPCESGSETVLRSW